MVRATRSSSSRRRFSSCSSSSASIRPVMSLNDAVSWPSWSSERTVMRCVKSPLFDPLCAAEQLVNRARNRSRQRQAVTERHDFDDEQEHPDPHEEIQKNRLKLTPCPPPRPPPTKPVESLSRRSWPARRAGRPVRHIDMRHEERRIEEREARRCLSDVAVSWSDSFPIDTSSADRHDSNPGSCVWGRHCPRDHSQVADAFELGS